MKIMQIAPGNFSAEEVTMRQVYAESLCSPGTTVKVVNIEGPSQGTDEVSLGLMVPGVLKRVEQAEQEGFDAAVTACFADPALNPAKCLATIPFVGGAEATYHLACLLADRWGLVAPLQELIPLFWRQAREYGVAGHIASMKCFQIPALELRQKRDEMEMKFVELARETIAEGAQLVIPACLAIMPTLGVGAATRLREKLGVPVVDPTAIALRTAEAMVNMGISQSKLAFPKSPQAGKCSPFDFLVPLP